MIQEFRIGKHSLLFDLDPERFASDNNLLWYATQRQLPEPEVITVMLRALKPGDCAVDAGANVGFFTVLMSKIVGADGIVIAIEPDENNLVKLRKNLDINSCHNVALHAGALGDRCAESWLYRHEDNGQSSLFGEGKASDNVKVCDLDLIIGHLYRPRILKMDIEGSEVAALLGCTFDFPCIVAEVNDAALKRAGHSARDLFNLLRERGYSRYQLHANGAMPSRIESYQDVVLKRENTNMLFAPRDYVAKHLWPEVEL